MASSPKTIQELFAFYNDFVKPLYAAVQLENELPVEVLFELNAALDHLARQYSYGETEQEVVSKAYAHLKRSCLDIFKLAVKDAIGQFNELRKTDTSIIDNGDYDRRLLELHHRIREDARNARLGEGDSRNDDGDVIKAFDLWAPVYADCVTLTKKFYFNANVGWAKKKQREGIWAERRVSFFVGVLTSIIASLLFWYFMPGLSSADEAKPLRHPSTQPTTQV